MNRFSNILFVEHSDSGDVDALDQVITLAINNQAQLTMIGVIENSAALIDDKLRDFMLEEKRKYIRNLLDTVSSGNLNVEFKVLVGRAYSEIIHDVIQFQRRFGG